MTKKALLAAAAMIALTACAGQELGKAQKTTADSTEFDNALAAGYLRLAQAEYKEGDYADSDYFALQSMAAANPLKVVDLPEANARNLPKADAIYVATARQELADILEAGARVKAPQLAATAQVAWRAEAGQTLAEAAQAVIDDVGGMGGDGGLIALDRDGNIAQPFNSQGMKRAWLTPAGEIGVEVFGR